jgi:release factor glutamine methyltransferase
MEAVAAMPTCTRLLHSAMAGLRGAGIPTARLDAEVLLALAMRTDRAGLYARLPSIALAGVENRLAALVERRARREPIAYITGVQEFWSLPFEVNPAVLIPRPETELLVELACRVARAGGDGKACRGAEVRRSGGAGYAVSEACGGADVRTRGGGEDAASETRVDLRSSAPPHLRTNSPGPARSICDVGTGSGCIAVALARELPDVQITAVDISSQALAVASRNASAHAVSDRITFVESDLLSGLDPEIRFDVIVSNPPYCRPEDLLSPELAYEPQTALLAGPDGLAVIRRLLAAAPARLRPGGRLVMELGRGQDGAVRTEAAAAALTDIDVEVDLAGIPRVLLACHR